ncbi:MAG: apolipoprotein N-acyltransferase [Bdellovibrionaceae bacterium]|nr:apolipoprotein N-acyltransferase [Bdellovibrio sp.]
MSKFLNFFKLIPRPFLFSILSGLLIGTSYIPFSGWFLLVCYAPLWLATLELQNEQASYKKIFFIGWISQFILTLIGFNWIYYVASEFGQLPWFICVGALFLFAAFMHLYIPISLVLGVWLIRKFKVDGALRSLLVFAITLALLERIWPSIFEWNLAYTLLWIKLPLFQWADTVGFWGLSTWILVIQAIISWGLLSLRNESDHRQSSSASSRNSSPSRLNSIVAFGSCFTFILVMTGLGILKQKQWAATDQQVNFGLVQGHVGNQDKLLAEKQSQYHTYLLGLYADMTEKLLATHPETEIVIWPETAMPFPLDPAYQPRPAPQQLLQRVIAWNRPLITGAYSIDPARLDHLGYPLTSNSVFFISEQGKMIGSPYNKSDLLVFGEYMPLGEHLQFLYQLFPFVGTYKRGDGPTVYEVPLKDKVVRIGAEICYESLNPGFSRNLAKKGSQIFFNVTNDSWFGWWAEPYQHGTMTLGRAIEIRRPLVRSTNSGVSSVILADGTQLTHSGIDVPFAYTYEVKYLENPPLSFYTRFGHWDWLVWLLALIGLLIYNDRKGSHVYN